MLGPFPAPADCPVPPPSILIAVRRPLLWHRSQSDENLSLSLARSPLLVREFPPVAVALPLPDHSDHPFRLSSRRRPASAASCRAMFRLRYFGTLSGFQCLSLVFFVVVCLVRVCLTTVVFVRDMTCILNNTLTPDCSDGIFSSGPGLELASDLVAVVHHSSIFVYFWMWNVWFRGTLLEIRFHLSPHLLRNLRSFKKLFIRQLAVFELFGQWAATTVFLFVVYASQESDPVVIYVIPCVESLGILTQIFAVVPLNFSAPQKYGPARYLWYTAVGSLLWTAVLTLIYDSLSVALKVYDPMFFSSRGLHALVLVLGTLLVSFRLSIFAIARRKLWNPKANGIQPNLKSAHAHFADQVGSPDGAFLYSSTETIPFQNVAALPISAITSNAQTFQPASNFKMSRAAPEQAKASILSSRNPSTNELADPPLAEEDDDDYHNVIN